MQQMALFEQPKRRRVYRAHVCDAGPGRDGLDNVQFSCVCGWKSDWQLMKRSDAKRGIPCPPCNVDQVV
jgi:hypothetical protein